MGKRTYGGPLIDIEGAIGAEGPVVGSAMPVGGAAPVADGSPGRLVSVAGGWGLRRLR